jgi:ABC-type lipoprotein release transport system permease subunit
MYSVSYGRRSALTLIAATPAILAICLLVAVHVRKSVDRKKDMAILKAVGWTTGDLVRLLFYRVTFISVPSVALGMATAFWLVFGSANQWIGTAVLGWSSFPPRLALDPQGAVIVLLEVSACVLIPFMGSALSPALPGAARDVQGLLQEGEV